MKGPKGINGPIGVMGVPGVNTEFCVIKDDLSHKSWYTNDIFKVLSVDYHKGIRKQVVILDKWIYNPDDGDFHSWLATDQVKYLDKEELRERKLVKLLD